MAAVHAGARTDVDDPVGRAHHLLVVLDDDQRVADVAQSLQRADQPLVVALVQADARLVEDVEHAHQAGADLRRQPDPLRLAAGKGVCRPIERQVIETDIDQEAEPLADLLQDLAGDQVLALGQRRARSSRPDRPRAASKKSRLSRHGMRRDLDDALAVDEHRPGFRLESRALAGRAEPRRHVSPQLFPDVVARSCSEAGAARFGITPSNGTSYERQRPLPDLYRTVTFCRAAVHEQVDEVLRQLAEGHVHRLLVLLAHRVAEGRSTRCCCRRRPASRA